MLTNSIFFFHRFLSHTYLLYLQLTLLSINFLFPFSIVIFNRNITNIEMRIYYFHDTFGSCLFSLYLYTVFFFCYLISFILFGDIFPRWENETVSSIRAYYPHNNITFASLQSESSSTLSVSTSGLVLNLRLRELSSKIDCFLPNFPPMSRSLDSLVLSYRRKSIILIAFLVNIKHEIWQRWDHFN